VRNTVLGCEREQLGHRFFAKLQMTTPNTVNSERWQVVLQFQTRNSNIHLLGLAPEGYLAAPNNRA
jgi:hypothetical protein